MPLLIWDIPASWLPGMQICLRGREPKVPMLACIQSVGCTLRGERQLAFMRLIEAVDRVAHLLTGMAETTESASRNSEASIVARALRRDDRQAREQRRSDAREGEPRGWGATTHSNRDERVVNLSESALLLADQAPGEASAANSASFPTWARWPTCT